MHCYALFVAFATPLLLVGVKALLLDRPCYIQGNPWKRINDVHHQARPVAMMGENVGHNPFNTFPGMEQYGNCMEVHFNLVYETLNITIVCGDSVQPSTMPSDPAQSYQCPVYVPGVAWPVANLIYFEYDALRFELSSCVTVNETHAYHGYFLLADKVESKKRRVSWPMWRKKMRQPGAVLFKQDGNCSACNFRNEYIAHVPEIYKNMDLAPPEAQPYCRDGHPAVSEASPSYVPMELNAATSELMMKLLIPGVVLFGGVILIRLCVCRKKATTETAAVGPIVTDASEKS